MKRLPAIAVVLLLAACDTVYFYGQAVTGQLNILGRRPDGFHELETLLQPVPCFDYLSLEDAGSGIELTCSQPGLPVDSSNLIHRATTAFVEASGVQSGIRIHLELGLNRIFGHPLAPDRLAVLAATLGSDVPFFLQSHPALCTGRGEQVAPLDSLPALRGVSLLLIHPGFGIPTPWAYQQLGRFPDALNGRPGRAARLIEQLKKGDLGAAAGEFYNSLEIPALEKYPILAIYQQFLRDSGATAALMSGSGSTTFALLRDAATAEGVRQQFLKKFGASCWTAVATL